MQRLMQKNEELQERQKVQELEQELRKQEEKVKMLEEQLQQQVKKSELLDLEQELEELRMKEKATNRNLTIL